MRRSAKSHQEVEEKKNKKARGHLAQSEAVVVVLHGISKLPVQLLHVPELEVRPRQKLKCRRIRRHWEKNSTRHFKHLQG